MPGLFGHALGSKGGAGGGRKKPAALKSEVVFAGTPRGRQSGRARTLPLPGSGVWAQTHDPLLATDEDPDGISLDVLADNMDMSHTAHHFPFLTDFEGAVVNDGQAVVGGPGNAIELQLDGDDGGGGLQVGPDHHVTVEAHRAREERVFAFVWGDGDNENRLGNLRQKWQGIRCGGRRAGWGIGLGLRGEAGVAQAEDGEGEGQRFLEGQRRAWLHRAK